MTIFGVDIAGSYQAGINIHQLKNEGYAFVACKATEGTTYQAPHFDEWIPAIKAEGMIPGAYHFLRNSDGAAQARFFLARLAKHGGPAGMLVQLDCEADASWAVVQAFVAEWNARTGSYPFAFYTGDWWLQPRGWNVASLTPYLWAAPNRGYTDSYTGDTANDWNAGYGGFTRMSIDQFTAKGTAGGIRGNVDIDAVRDPAVLATLVRGAGPVPAPKPSTGLAVDGQLGPATVRRWQQVMGTVQDGVITQPPGRSSLVAAVQRHLNSHIGVGLTVDGQGIRQDGHTVSLTTRALQRYLGTPQDGVLSLPSSECVKALQRRLNEGRF
ncbi:glycoside hydrolase family 25 protein [Dactylosporangium sp. NPDC051541]|uniref:glycoside hydrolase family 25 protein n=1 Tax=Dactylosporangium sp. NPDC051541 TaxID=3363977 RepID=UPI0037BAF694